LFTQFLPEHAIPGSGVAVTRDGKLVYARGFGYADVEAKKPVQPHSLFRLASVSKPITAVGVLTLVERGQLKLEDPVLKHLSLQPFVDPKRDRDPRWEKITVLHCLQHTGGWDRDKKGGFDPIGMPREIRKAMQLKAPPRPEDLVRYMMGLPLDFDPGTKMVYANVGYLILGRVIEAVTGEKYEAWIKRHILEPIQAKSLSLGRALPEHRSGDEVKYYDSKKLREPCLYPPREGQLVPIPDGGENLESYEAHGGWISSPIDMVRFAAAFDYERKSPLLTAATIKDMWARPLGPAGTRGDKKPKAVYYGCGWEVRPIPKTGRANAWHSGWISGSSTLLVRRFDGFNWAILFNTELTPRGKDPASLIDAPMHEAIDAVKEWPSGDLFEHNPNAK
jgi:N-acyl-D-amino-acid deacylase